MNDAPGLGEIQGVAPAWVLDRVRRFNREVLNPVMRRLAGRAPFSLAMLSHRGRQSGRLFRVPVLVTRSGDTVVVPLTYGDRADWVRNILAGGRAGLLLHGRVLLLDDPRVVPPNRALPAFAPALRIALRLVGMRWFLALRAAQSGRGVA